MTRHKVLIQLRFGIKSNTKSLNRDFIQRRSWIMEMLGQPVNTDILQRQYRVYLPDTDFPVLLMHSCLT